LRLRLRLSHIIEWISSWEHIGYCGDAILGFVVPSDAAHQPGVKETSNKKCWRKMEEGEVEVGVEANGCCSLIRYIIVRT
jgi:hypothetical protein